MAHEPNSMIKLEIECNNINIKPITSQSQNSLSNNLPNTLTNSRTNQTVNNTATGSVSAKMGSRRIFTPQFKLQVLESYRNDSDCKGNQRATARKYGIHRRQIQKWLQCENNLRSSVANLNQNNMKHQFHNISHHHQIPVVSSSSATAITATTATHTTNNININNNSNNNQQYKTNILSLDSSRHSVGLTPRPMTVQIPVPVAPTATTSAIVAPSTVMAASPPSRPATTIKCASDSNISAITATPVSTTSPLLKSPTHTITKIQAPSYNINTPVVPDTMLTHTPAISSISSVPLVHHYSQHHYSQQQHQSHTEQHQLQQQEQQHSHHYYHTQHQHQQYENRLLMPSASLPIPRSNSPVSTATNRTDELRDYQPITMTGNCYMKEDCRNEQQTYENFHYCTNKSGLIAPIDLSLGPRQAVYEGEIQINARHNMNDDETKMNIVQTTNVWPEMEANNNECKDNAVKNEIQESSQIDSQAIDLTCRKRKNYNENDAPVEKIPKTCNTNEKEPTDVNSARKPETGTDNAQQPKPVKLFKPYLLDDDESNDRKKVKSEPHDPIIWSYHPNCATSSANYDNNQTLNNFQSTEHGYPFPTGSPTFQRDNEHSGYTTTATGTPSPSGYVTRTTPPITTPSALWCPKGSPVSGYDSASTYSDSSDYVYRSQHQYHHHYPPPQCQTYSLDLKMQPVDSYYYDMTCRADQLSVAGKLNVHRNDVQRWLDQENDIRQGIAVYV